MRGNPLWQLMLVVVAFTVLGLPVWRLTRPAQAATVMAPVDGATGAATPATTAGPVTLGLEADFAPTPAEWALSYLGETVLQGKGVAQTTGTWKAVLPPEGADLVLHVTWPPIEGGASGGGSANAAARVVVRWPDGREVEKSFWSPGGAALESVLTVGDGGVK